MRGIIGTIFLKKIWFREILNGGLKEVKAAEQLGAAALRDEAYFRETVGRIMATRERTKERLAGLGFQFADSKSNFIFATHPQLPARELFEALKEKHIYVRYFSKPRIDNYLRITIGTDEQMDILIGFLEEYKKAMAGERA